MLLLVVQASNPNRPPGSSHNQIRSASVQRFLDPCTSGSVFRREIGKIRRNPAAGSPHFDQTVNIVSFNVAAGRARIELSL